MKRVLGGALLVLLALAPAAAQNGPTAYVEPPNLGALAAAAAKEGTLTLGVGSSFGGLRGAQLAQERIRQLYHVTLDIRYAPVGSGGRFLLQLIQEVRAGQTASSDVMFQTDRSTVAPYLQPVGWRKYDPALPAGDVLYDGRSVKVLTALVGFDYNTKLVPQSEVPRSFLDLLEPQWKGKIATSPYQARFMSYLGLPDVFGHNGMVDYVKKFSAQLGGVMNCGDVDRVVSGEFAIFGLDCGDHEVRLRQRKGEPVGSIYPKEGTQRNYTSPGIPLTAAHPNAARLFLTYLLSRQGQRDLWDLVGQDDDLLPGSHMAKIIADLRRQGVNIVEGTEGTGLDLRYPQLDGYVNEITPIITQGK